MVSISMKVHESSNERYNERKKHTHKNANKQQRVVVAPASKIDENMNGQGALHSIKSHKSTSYVCEPVLCHAAGA